MSESSSLIEDSSSKAGAFALQVKNLVSTQLGIAPEMVNVQEGVLVKGFTYGSNLSTKRTFASAACACEAVSGREIVMNDLSLSCGNGGCKFFIVIEDVAFDQGQIELRQRMERAACYVYVNGCSESHLSRIQAEVDRLKAEVVKQVAALTMREPAMA